MYFTQEQLIDFGNFLLRNKMIDVFDESENIEIPPIPKEVDDPAAILKRGYSKPNPLTMTVTSQDFNAWREITLMSAGILEAKERIKGFMFMHGMKEIDEITLEKLFMQIVDPTYVFDIRERRSK